MTKNLPGNEKEEIKPITMTWLPKEKHLTKLEGPYECPECGGHVMLDAIYLDQVEEIAYCPYCTARGNVTEEEITPEASPLNKVKIMNKSVKELWQELGNISINDNEHIEQVFKHFPIGTPREHIWHWFENTFDISVYEDLMFSN